MPQFWELDTDHDFVISKEDLLRYGNHSLTYRIIDRIFSQVRACFDLQVAAHMLPYEDLPYICGRRVGHSRGMRMARWGMRTLCGSS